MTALPPSEAGAVQSSVTVNGAALTSGKVTVNDAGAPGALGVAIDCAVESTLAPTRLTACALK